MNLIVDLTARAVSFITVIQTTLLRGAIAEKIEDDSDSILTISPAAFKERIERFIAFESDVASGECKKTKDDNFLVRAVELIWISRKELDRNDAIAYTIQLGEALITWIRENDLNGISAMRAQCGKYPSPYKWRELINNNIYDDAEKRVKLAKALEYLPIQVVLALGAGNFTAQKQRILQMWNVSDASKKKLLNDYEIEILDSFKTLEENVEKNAETLLRDRNLLFDCLIKNGVPLSFEIIFDAELEEIKKNRIYRKNEQCITESNKQTTKPESTENPSPTNEQLVKPEDANTQPPPNNEPVVKSENTKEPPPTNDPFKKGKDMKLLALALSGGGIRSATFNLGILEGLAKRNMIKDLDYMSSVSGGGYIATWLAAWIKRDGSVAKVTNRLCPDKSPDPLGEELKPIKWLRMFSNYFAPNSSIMSADSWTIGVTWLRNTILNQIIIFLLLLSVLFAGNFLYVLWLKALVRNIVSSDLQIYGWSLALLIPVALLAGFGMHAYHSDSVRWIRIRKENTNVISKIIIALSLVGAYFLSAWLDSKWSINNKQWTTTLQKLEVFYPSGIITFIALTLVAGLGKYDDCIVSFKIKRPVAWLILLGTALAAAIVGLLCLVGVTTIFEHLQTSSRRFISPRRDELQFILGIPLTLEIFTVTVIARMALLGQYFPDERREWWGRIGAYIHRISFFWILISASALLGHNLFALIFSTKLTGFLGFGSWAALVGSTVKTAFSAKVSGKSDSKSSLNVFLNLFSEAGPYLFLFGLLILLPGLIKPLLHLQSNFVRDIFHNIRPHAPELPILVIMLLSAGVAYFLSRQVGVNEFSMHHFYRNRLVRAFLGATRRTTDRQRSANPFTGFDMADDIKLHKLKSDYGYYGPYPILNTALNASQELALDRQDRKAESFIFSPLYCGFDFSMVAASADGKNKSYDFAYRQTKFYAYKDEGPTIGTAMAISGAAINPNQGYHSSVATAFLLTVFNVQMGRWMGNPRKCTWQYSDPKFGLAYILNNLMAKTSTRNDFFALSDGGHFDNMGLYEMIRRKCTVIIVSDAEQDDEFVCEGLANAIRRCRIDFGAEIDIDISTITDRNDKRFSKEHHAIGKIKYAGDNLPSGHLIYIKASLMGDEPVDVHEYALKNTTFPHQTTADQFFDEEQFESYRKLGLSIANKVFSPASNVTDILKSISHY